MKPIHFFCLRPQHHISAAPRCHVQRHFFFCSLTPRCWDYAFFWLCRDRGKSTLKPEIWVGFNILPEWMTENHESTLPTSTHHRWNEQKLYHKWTMLALLMVMVQDTLAHLCCMWSTRCGPWGVTLPGRRRHLWYCHIRRQVAKWQFGVKGPAGGQTELNTYTCIISWYGFYIYIYTPYHT